MTDSPDDDFFVGYGPLPNKDRRFLLKALPAIGLGVGATALGAGFTARSTGGGRWETGTSVSLIGRIAFLPYPTLWTEDGDALLLSGTGKVAADAELRPFDGQTVQLDGIRIVREDCVMLGVTRGSVRAKPQAPTTSVPAPVEMGLVSAIGEVLDAQCYMGIMNPGYGRTHRGCAAQCIRGGQPVFFLPGIGDPQRPNMRSRCGGQGFLLADGDGGKINDRVDGHVAVPVTVTATHEKIGPFERLRIIEPGFSRIANS